MSRKKTVSVIGPNAGVCTPEIYAFGEKLGKALADRGFRIVSGGMAGLMEAVSKGARDSDSWQDGITVGIIPFLEKEKANDYCDIVIPTGIGIARNQLVVASGDVVVAVAGGAGTLSEIAFAWQMGKPVICYSGFGGWSEKLAGEALDARHPGRVLIRAKSLEEVVAGCGG
jgi:uncharacterized protein (TIGR00725 family)